MKRRYKIEIQKDGWLINNKVFVDKNGTLWNDFNNLRPYRDFPQIYFEIAEKLTKREATS